MKIIIAFIIILMLVAGTAIYFSLNVNKADTENDIAAQGSGNTDTQQNASVMQNNADTGSNNTSLQADMPLQAVELLSSEDIIIASNSPEYELKMTLVEDMEKQTSLILEYYYEGTGVVNTLDSKAIPEIEGIFEKRAENSTESNTYMVSNAHLNSKLAKVYFIINGNGSLDMIQSDMYVFSLADASMKKLFSNRGKYGRMSFNKDFRFLGYSYNDPPESSILQEASLLEIIDCNTDDFAVRNSRTKENKKIGSNLKPESVYDYTLVSWYSNNTVKLLQKPVSDDKKDEVEVLYDISRDLILNIDGSIAATDKPQVESGNSEKPPVESAAVESAAVTVLKDFYTYLAAESDYSKAMELLDEKFIIRLEIFKQFGISELTKSDISAEDASMFSKMLKAARLDTIASEELKDGTAIIYYYQTMELSPENQVRQPMSAQIKKTKNGWKITVLQDADESKPPFAVSQ